MQAIINFRSTTGNYKFMSNYYPCILIVDNKRYYHVEGFYQASKFIGINDEAAEHIRMLKLPGDAKKISRSYKLTEFQLDEWNGSKKVIVMKRAVLLKFLGNIDIQKLLLDTEDAELIEYAPWDEYWGSGKYGNGENMLGKILMEVRNIIANDIIDFTIL